MNKNSTRILFILVLIIAVSICRFFPHIFNFSPIGAICLFGAAHFRKKWMAVALPLVLVIGTDIILNNTIYATESGALGLFYKGAFWVYFSYFLIVLLGVALYTKKITLANVFGGAIGATVIFYLLTNFVAWYANPIYAQSWSGLMASYAAGIPFIKGSFLGNLCFTPLLFGTYYLLQQRYDFLKLRKMTYAVI